MHEFANKLLLVTNFAKYVHRDSMKVS